MADFTEFRESNRIKNVAIQRVLRQIDTEDLAMVLVGLSEEDRKIFYRNVSRFGEMCYDFAVRSWQLLSLCRGAG